MSYSVSAKFSHSHLDFITSRNDCSSCEGEISIRVINKIKTPKLYSLIVGNDIY